MDEIINEVADRLSRLLDAAEELFCARFVGRAEIPLGVGDEQTLVFGKFDGDHGIWIVTTKGDGGRTLLLKASARLRVEAASRLDALWTACELADAELLRKNEEACEIVERFIAEHSPMMALIVQGRRGTEER